MTPQTVMMPETNAPFRSERDISSLTDRNGMIAGVPVDPVPSTSRPARTDPTTMAPTETPYPSQREDGERVDLSTVEKMVIGVAIAVTIILIGILVSVSTRR
jgi:hypothetical protein